MSVRSLPASALMRAAALSLPLLGVAAVVAAAAPAVGWAQTAPVFEGQGLIDLLPPTGMVGDGSTAADLYVLALGPNGLPITGIKGKPMSMSGTPGELVEVGGGLYKFSFVPAAVTAPGTAEIVWKAKTPAKEAINRTWKVAVFPSTAHPLTVAANPAQATLGQDKTANVALTLANADTLTVANADLRAVASSGTVANLTNLGGGQFSALYNVPNLGYPHIALITASDRRDPTRSYGGVAVPLVGKTEFPVSVAPNAKVIIRVAGREFGPVPADAGGKAKVPIVVPPGAGMATLVQVQADGKTVEQPLDLKIPETRRLAFIPSLAGIPGDPSANIVVRVLVVTPDGKPDGNAALSITASAGEVSAPRHEGGGIYVAAYKPATATAAGSVTLTATITGGAAVQKDTLVYNVVPVRPGKVEVSASPAKLASGADSFTVTAKASAPDGTALPGRSVTFAADGAKLKEVKDNKNGEYVATFTTTGSGPAQVMARVATPPTGNPLARVIVAPGASRVNNDGLSSNMLLVATVDEYGYPVPNVGVNLKLVSGDGALPATTTTGADGLAQVYYTSGRANGLVSVEASASGVTGTAAMVQAPAGIGIPDLPPTGNRNAVALAVDWMKALGSLRVDREGATGMAAPSMAAPVVAAGTVTRPPDPTPTAAAPATTPPAATTGPTVAITAASAPPAGTVTRPDAPARMVMIADQLSVDPGASVPLRINLADSSGRGVAGQTLSFTTTAGSVGGVKEVGNGVYTATFNVPKNASGTLKVIASTKDGTVATDLLLPVNAPAPTPVAATAPATTAPATTAPATTAPATTAPTVAVTTPPATTTPAATTTTTTTTGGGGAGLGEDHPWARFRVGAVFGTYSYTQIPKSQGTTLFPHEVPFEGAGAAGFGLNARVWAPSFRNLGVDAGLRVDRYSINPQSLCDYLNQPCPEAAPVGDWVPDLHVLGLARYGFGSGSSEFWAGARVGYAYSDIGGVQATQSELNFPQFGVNSLAVGAELGAEIGERVFFTPSFTEYLAGGGSPFSTNLDVELGVAITEQIYASAAYNLTIRRIDVRNGDNVVVGELSDSFNGATVSVGFQL